MHTYTHPHRSPEHIMNVYRRYLVGQKRIWMEQGKGHRCLRGIMNYRTSNDSNGIYHSGFVKEYLAAKALTIKILKEGGEFPRVRQRNKNREEILTVFLQSKEKTQND